MTEGFEHLPREQQLRLAVYSEVFKICVECETKINMTFDKEAKCLIAELIWKRLKTYSEDLELFSKHAKRSTVQGEDIKLLARRNTTLKARITQMIEEQIKQRKPSTTSTERQSTDTDVIQIDD